MGIFIGIVVIGFIVMAALNSAPGESTKTFTPVTKSQETSIEWKVRNRSKETKALILALGSDYNDMKKAVIDNYTFDEAFDQHTLIVEDYGKNMDYYFNNDRETYIKTLISICVIEDAYFKEMVDVERTLRGWNK